MNTTTEKKRFTTRDVMVIAAMMRSVSKQLRALAEKGHIILMITHDLECALATCSRALVIRNCTLADDFQIDDAWRLMAAMRE